MRQRIRFCPTPAGKVAYSVIGQGPFLICDTGWVSHLEKDAGDRMVPLISWNVGRGPADASSFPRFPHADFEALSRRRRPMQSATMRPPTTA